MWRTLTNVRFAVVQIILLAVLGLIGTITPQLPAFALRDPGAYALFMADMDLRFSALLGALGPPMVDLLERLGFFRIFSSPLFITSVSLLLVSIVVCTLDRTPKLWRGVRRVTVEQPDAFFDARLPERARFEAGALAPDQVAAVLRGRRFAIRRAEAGDGGTSWVYGDRHQYLKLSTLLTHTGLVLFLLGGAVTSAMGFETFVFVGEGQTAPVQPVGTPDNLLVKNVRFEAPMRPDGSFEDFRTDLAVYQNGELVARKVIRVNDPLEVQGFVFHQNTFGPSADLEIRDGDGRLAWTGPVLLAGALDDLPRGDLTIPGSEVAMVLVLQRDSTGTPLLAMVGVGPDLGDGRANILFQARLGVGATSDPADTAGYAITWVRPGAFTGMVIKNDPGAPIIWTAFLFLISGLVLSFYFPRRRVWARFTPAGLQVAMLADRYVDARREFDALLEELAARSGRSPERRAEGGASG